MTFLPKTWDFLPKWFWPAWVESIPSFIKNWYLNICKQQRPSLPGSWSSKLGHAIALSQQPFPSDPVNLSCVCATSLDSVGYKWLLHVFALLLRLKPPEEFCPLCVTYTWWLLKRHFGHSRISEFNAPESNMILSLRMKLTQRDKEYTVFMPISL